MIFWSVGPLEFGTGGCTQKAEPVQGVYPLGASRGYFVHPLNVSYLCNILDTFLQPIQLYWNRNKNFSTQILLLAPTEMNTFLPVHITR